MCIFCQYECFQCRLVCQLIFSLDLMQSMSGLVTGSWEGVRVKALATHPTFDLIYAADTHCRIRQYNFADKTSSTL